MRYKSLFLIIILCSCYIGDEVAPDQQIWNYDIPSNNGLDQESLLFINTSIFSEVYEQVEGLIIIKDDMLVFENYYFNNANRDYSRNIGIAGLSITLAAVGVAEDLGFLSLDDEIGQYLPEYEDVFNENPDKSTITIRNLLTHQSGLSWNESIVGYFSPDSHLQLMKNTDDWVEFVLERPLEAPPGRRYSFNTANGVLLSKIIENASQTDFQTFLTESILNPLTIQSVSIEQDPGGNYNGGDGYQISLLDWTKLGYLFLKEGIWKGRTIINPNFIQESRTSQFAIQGFRSSGFNYEEIGYLWGLFGDPSEGAFGADHSDIFYSYGQLGQSLFIIPSENMIVAILSDNFFFSSQQSLKLVRRNKLRYSIVHEPRR